MPDEEEETPSQRADAAAPAADQFQRQNGIGMATSNHKGAAALAAYDEDDGYAAYAAAKAKVGCCRSTLSNPC